MSVVFFQNSLPLVDRSHNSENRTRSASNPRKMNANVMRNMQVPAYGPAPVGVQAFEYSGVVVDVKNTIIISDIPIMPLMSIELEEVDSGDEGIVMLPISIVAENAAVLLINVFLDV